MYHTAKITLAGVEFDLAVNVDSDSQTVEYYGLSVTNGDEFSTSVTSYKGGDTYVSQTYGDNYTPAKITGINNDMTTASEVVRLRAEIRSLNRIVNSFMNLAQEATDNSQSFSETGPKYMYSDGTKGNEFRV